MQQHTQGSVDVAGFEPDNVPVSQHFTPLPKSRKVCLHFLAQCQAAVSLLQLWLSGLPLPPLAALSPLATPYKCQHCVSIKH